MVLVFSAFSHKRSAEIMEVGSRCFDSTRGTILASAEMHAGDKLDIKIGMQRKMPAYCEALLKPLEIYHHQQTKALKANAN